LTRTEHWVKRIGIVATIMVQTKKINKGRTKGGELLSESSVTPQGFLTPTTEDIRAGKPAKSLRGRERNRGR